VILIYMVMLINKKSLMKDWTNSHAYNAVAWVAVVIMIGLTLALASITVKQLTQKASRQDAVRQYRPSFFQTGRL
jgi:Mn2+/Fe2+ NRAMP family transporter